MPSPSTCPYISCSDDGSESNLALQVNVAAVITHTGLLTGFLTFSYGVLTRTLIFSNAGREVRFQNWRLPSSSCRLSSFVYSG